MSKKNASFAEVQKFLPYMAICKIIVAIKYFKWLGYLLICQNLTACNAQSSLICGFETQVNIQNFPPVTCYLSMLPTRLGQNIIHLSPSNQLVMSMPPLLISQAVDSVLRLPSRASKVLAEGFFSLC